MEAAVVDGEPRHEQERACALEEMESRHRPDGFLHDGETILASMRLVIVRHAEAAPGQPDELRPLTPAGREQARRLGDELRAESVDAVVSSPLLRARETAAALGLGQPEVDERLAPGAGPDDMRAAAAGRGATVVVVGHQPDCGRAAAALGGGEEPPFPPCGRVTVIVS
jgi:phosphohistidine phosphatase